MGVIVKLALVASFVGVLAQVSEGICREGEALASAKGGGVVSNAKGGVVSIKTKGGMVSSKA